MHQKIRKNTGTILVVEDQPATLYLLASILEGNNYRVIKAFDGQHALKALEEYQKDIDIILLDRMMPGIDGMELTKKLQADPNRKDIPIVMLTAADKPEDISEGIKAGVFYYLTKPIERKTLLSILSAAVQESKQRKALQAEMHRHRMGFGLIEVMHSSYKSLEEAKSLSSFLANCFPDKERALTGISELLINAVEHGNLGVTYDEKTALLENNTWRQELEQRMRNPYYANRRVKVSFEKKNKTCSLQITDEGQGFNWKSYMEFDPSRASHNHGRGIAMANIVVFDRLLFNESGNQVTAEMRVNSE